MNQQKGQAYIAVLIVLVVGFILYTNFSGKSIFGGKSILPASPEKSTSEQESKISAPPKQEKTPSPSLTPAVPTQTPPDTAPPKRLNPQPRDKSILPGGTRETIFGLETGEKATCKYGTVSGLSYDSMQDFLDRNIATTSHFILITTLNDGEKYKYYVRCMDERSNKNTDDFPISFEVKLPEDKTAPVLSNPSHQGSMLAAGTKEAVITISTNEAASCRYSVNAGTAYNSMSGGFSYYDQTKQFHTKKITGLADGKSYDFFVRCRDSAGNVNTKDVLISFSVGI